MYQEYVVQRSDDEKRGLDYSPLSILNTYYIGSLSIPKKRVPVKPKDTSIEYVSLRVPFEKDPKIQTNIKP
jgi:hypothetical protein